MIHNADPVMAPDLKAELGWRFNMRERFLADGVTREVYSPDHVTFNKNTGAIGYNKEKLKALVKNARLEFEDSMTNKGQIIRNSTGMVTNSEFYEISREMLSSLFRDPQARNIYRECGYPEFITPAMYRGMIEREGLAERVNNVWPEECFAECPDIYETEDEDEDKQTPFEERFPDFEKETSFFHYCERLDKASGIGSFGALLFLLNDGKALWQPAAGIDPRTGEMLEGDETQFPEMKVKFRVFDESEIHVSKWVTDPLNPRVNCPEFYLIRMTDPDSIPIGESPSGDLQTRLVHWTRIHHQSDNCKSNEWFGTPRLRDIYNRLLDCRKILSGSGEMFWKGAFPGYAFETNPDLMDPLMDKESLRQEFKDYSEGLQRYLAVTGVTVKSLTPQMGDPSAHYDTQVRSITMSKGVPWRVFVGSEQSQLASEQDTAAWNKRVMHRCVQYLTPRMLRPILDRLIAFRCLPKPSQMLTVEWQEASSATETNRADIMLKAAQTVATLVGGDCERFITPLMFLTVFGKISRKKAQQIVDDAKAHVAKGDFITPPEPVPVAGGGKGPTATRPNNGGMRK